MYSLGETVGEGGNSQGDLESEIVELTRGVQRPLESQPIDTDIPQIMKQIQSTIKERARSDRLIKRHQQITAAEARFFAA